MFKLQLENWHGGKKKTRLKNDGIEKTIERMNKMENEEKKE